MRYAVLTVLLIATAAVRAGPYDAAIDALGRGQPEAARVILEPLAQGGDLAAQTLMGHVALTTERYLDAYGWFHAAAECGSQDAAVERGMLASKLTAAAREKATARGDAWHDAYCQP